MKKLSVLALIISFNAMANCPQESLKTNLDELSNAMEQKSACEELVLGHYQEIYHRTLKAASNTFLNNFIGRKNTFAHALGHPRVAFLKYSINDNFIADNIVDKSGQSKEEVYEKYMQLLKSGKLCEDLKDDIKKPRKVRRYLLDELRN